jgi:hypothetical protein
MPRDHLMGWAPLAGLFSGPKPKVANLPAPAPRQPVDYERLHMEDFDKTLEHFGLIKKKEVGRTHTDVAPDPDVAPSLDRFKLLRRAVRDALGVPYPSEFGWAYFYGGFDEIDAGIPYDLRPEDPVELVISHWNGSEHKYPHTIEHEMAAFTNWRPGSSVIAYRKIKK